MWCYCTCLRPPTLTSLCLFPSADYFLASLPRPPLLSHFLSLVLYSSPPTVPSSLLPSLMVPFPRVSLPSCCRNHAKALTFSSFLATSLTLSLPLFFFHSHFPLLCLQFIFYQCVCFPTLLLLLSACWRLECDCEFPLLKVWGWAVS